VRGLVQSNVVSVADVLVKVVDINDNQPLFTNSTYTGFVTESQNSNTDVLQFNGEAMVVSANDFDEGLNGKIKYSFVEENTNIYFNIDEDTGRIKTNLVNAVFLFIYMFLKETGLLKTDLAWILVKN